jgi:hypothetical protein
MNSSSQSFAPMSRLLWKEYRAQRAFWSAMLLFGVAPQLLFRIFLGNSPDAIAVIWSMVGLAPCLFAIGSAAILFAGEREERTSDWLVQLSVPPLWMLLAKWGFVLIASLALTLVLLIASVILVWNVPTLRPDIGWWEPIAFSLWIFAGLFLWGVLGSLLSRRVVTAVPAMAFWWLMTMVVPVIWLPWLFGITFAHRWHQRTQEILMVLAYVAVGGMDVWLGWRWCLGKYLDAQFLDDLSLKLTAFQNRLRGRTETTSRVPAHVESDNAWSREWQRLTWQERHREAYHRSLLYVGCALGPLLAVLSVVQGVDLIPGIFPLVIAMPLAMGVLGFRYDGEGQPLRFLSSRGISARTLWLANHAVWLPRAIWIPSVMWLVALAAEQLLPSSAIFSNGHRQLLEATYQVWASPFTLVWFVLLSYGLGHFAAIVFRRVILAGAAGVTLTLISVPWLVLMAELEVPSWWSIGAVVLWIFVLSWSAAPDWMMERRFFGRPARLAMLVLPPVLLIGAVGLWRASEIPGFGTTPLTSSAILHPRDLVRLDPEIESRQVRVELLESELKRQSAPITPADQQVLDRLALSLGGFNTVVDFQQQLQMGLAVPPQGIDDDPEMQRSAKATFWTANQARLNEIMEIARSERVPSASRWLSLNWSDGRSSNRGLLPHQQLLLEAGRLRTDEAHLVDALDYYCASLRLASFWATDSGLKTRYEAERQQLYILAEIIAWANHPDQTAETLRSAIRRVQVEFALFPSIRENLVAQFRFDRGRLEEIIQHGVTPALKMPDGASREWRTHVAQGARHLPWERFRGTNLLEQELLERELTATVVLNLLQQPGIDAPRWIEYRESRKFPDWFAVNPTWRNSTPLAVQLTAGWEIQAGIIERETVIRESVLALALLAWKHEHQQWPEWLGEVLKKDEAEEALPAVTIIDPWNGEQFQYAGSLLNHHDAGQGQGELLVSVGPQQAREVIADDPQDGHGTTAHALTVGTRNWQGIKLDAANDDRLRLTIVAGRVALRIPGFQESDR